MRGQGAFSTRRLVQQLLSKNRTSPVYYEVSKLLSPPAEDIIEISPPANIFVVEFTSERHLGVSVILPATCELMARLEAWRLFPEYKRNASMTSVYRIQFAEYDWETDRFILVKQRKQPTIPVFFADQPNQNLKKKRRTEESSE
jgi:hypothetical protein